MLELNKIYNADCLEGIKQLDDNSIDAIITDPPYGISNEIKITRGRNKMKFKGSDLTNDFGNWDKFNNMNEFMQFTYNWVDECVRVLRNGGIFISYFDRDKINFLSHYLQNRHSFRFKDYFADCKSNPVPQARKVKWSSGFEIVGMWQKPDGKLTYNFEYGQQANYIIRPIVGGKERSKHPTQKSQKVLELFLKYWTNENDIVLDPFMGSGTTAVACAKLNRNYIGFDSNPEYCQIAEKRLEKYKGQRRLV